MKLDGWKKRLSEHQAKITALESSGEMHRIWKFQPRKFREIYKRLGYLKQKVETLTHKER